MCIQPFKVSALLAPTLSPELINENASTPVAKPKPKQTRARTMPCPRGSAREALIAEALGDLAHLLDRAEALRPAMLDSRQTLLAAHAQLAQQLANFEVQVVGFTEKVKVHTVKHIQASTDEAARQLVQIQTKAMNEAAQTLFRAEIHPALQRLAAPMYQLLQHVEHPWKG